MAEPCCIPYADIHVGDRAAGEWQVTADIVDRFSALIGDTDSFHVSDEAAARTVFGRRIAHAVHLAAFVSVLIGQKLPGWGTIYCSQTYEFYRPVYLEETVTVEVTVLDKLPRRRLRLRTAMKNAQGQLVLDGAAVVKTHR